ncbi:alpha-amylase family glycosyl hydrolase [Parvularcula lutaonensis]|uniref:Alpha-amylase family glycosyl hydrolase n=1 Tax=Parvularcula lutaonensis TaxID=491923 RepID=A0ABV7MA91_9PROT|nr:alpha-amylase family glycosyl hydrolase [Parvularcula lutaonensis]GGY45441.1 alpha-amylase [Parvularcula lutaonensis]
MTRHMAAFAASLLAATAMTAAASAQVSKDLDRPVEDDVIYFMLPDRFENGDPSNDTGGMDGGRLEHGFDPTHKGFYHGGDLKGLTARLDYLEGMGVNAIWLGPIYKNKPVQGGEGVESAGYHGYWITDFLDVDPHLGTREDLEAFVDAAHARGMKVILDIITNHTADVIQMRECHDPEYDGDDPVEGFCPYRNLADYPMTTRGPATGETINEGFMGLDIQTEENFARLERADWAYTPFVPEAEANVKNPAWLNDPIHYHNRGNFTDPGETFLFGDFFGLDDLMTEDPVVINGMIEIFGSWIEDFGIDGFRIDTARHIQPSFWRAFVPAMLEKAEGIGKENFYIFGEVFDPDPAALARHTWDDRFPATLDFAFQDAVRDVVAEGEGTRRLARLFEADTLYRGGRAAARRLPTFLGNHDMGRFSQFIREANPDASEEEMLARLKVAHVLLMTARGVPTLYSGSEQGFVSDEGDQGAREDMFESQVAIYNDNDLLGTDATTAEDNFDTGHPLYLFIRDLVDIRKNNEALRHGRQVTRFEEVNGGLFAFSRLGKDGSEILTVINAGTEDRTEQIRVQPESSEWSSLLGSCGNLAQAQASYRVTVPALSAVICKSQS